MESRASRDCGTFPSKSFVSVREMTLSDFALWFWRPRGRSNRTRCPVLALANAKGVGYSRISRGQTQATSSAFVWTRRTSARRRWKGRTFFARQGNVRKFLFPKRAKNPLRPGGSFTAAAASLLDQKMLCSRLRPYREEELSPSRDLRAML